MTRWRLAARPRAEVRVLRSGEWDQALEVCARDPVAGVMAAEQIAALRLARRPYGEVWACGEEGHLTAICWVGANLSPIGAWDEAGLDRLADLARRRGRSCSSLVGPRELVEPLWERLTPTWGPARELRLDQPSLAISRTPMLDADPRVRLVRPDEVERLFPAAVAMFTEEVGFSPLEPSGSYQRRVTDLVAQSRCFARFGQAGEPEVVFKADIGAMYGGVAQVQGVWVAPEMRGRGVGAAGMARVVDLTRERLAPTVSLYVNAYNAPALAVYRRVGFERAGTFSTVLL